ncbi:MAG: DNA primase [Sphingomonadales bacterium]|nr:DNA primase [Sphingomonadales bacterium]
MISPATIQQIMARTDITDVVGSFVKLKKRGTNLLGLCPFHNEKTPSFTVSPSKEIYKCFGCGKSGNTISFVMEHEKYSYPEALKWLAQRYGIEIEESFINDEQRQQLQTADNLYALNQFAQQFFTDQLHSTEEGQDVGLAYFREREFSELIIKKFQLGYSPEQRDAFTNAAVAAQFNPALMIKSGLVANRYDQLSDNYRGRVIFPIHNHSGKILGFGARTLKKTDTAPKYINTPENEIYVKSKILYGSYFARQAIDKANECLLVEGYTDVISLHQSGIENVVASGGTALTPDQLRLVKKYTNNLTIIYDGDAAGIKAALRGLDLALEEGLQVQLVLIPDGEDPDSYVNKVGAAAFRDFVQQHKKDVILFQLEVAMKDAGTDASKKAAVVNRMAETISRINKAEDFTKQQDYIKQCATVLKIDEAGLHTLVNKYIRDRIQAQERKAAPLSSVVVEENAQRSAASNFDDATFLLLFRDELQEKEVARILLEFGHRPWNEQQRVSDYIFEEIADESLLENEEVQKLFMAYKALRQQGEDPKGPQYFLQHPDQQLSTLAVSLIQFPHEESTRWKTEFSQNAGYQSRLFEQDYDQFITMLAAGQESSLQQFLKAEEDRSSEVILSAIHYLKLRKIKRMLLENQQDMEKNQNTEDIGVLLQTHEHLKQMEIALGKQSGSVIIR